MAVSIYKKFSGRAHPLETFSDLRARALAACSFPGGPTQELETFKFFFIFLFSFLAKSSGRGDYPFKLRTIT